jgi:hypothetical protein
MQMRTSQKIMPNITPTTKPTDPGSDEYMIQRGYHPSSVHEEGQYGRFANKEGFVSIVSGVIYRWAAKHYRGGSVVAGSAAQTAGSSFPPDRQQQEQSNTPRNVAVATAVFQEESGQWQMARWGQPELKC